MRSKAILALFSILIWGPPAAAADDKNTDASKPIVVGIATAQTSFMAQFDVPATIGAQMAIEDINKAGGVLGRQLKWIYQDTKSDKGQAVIAATQLIEQGAHVLLVSCDFDYGGPSASVAQEKNLIALGCAGSPRFGKQGIGPNAFSLDTQTPDEGGTVAEWAFLKQGWKTAYLLTDTSIDYTKTLTQYFETRWKQLAGETSILGRDTFLNSDPSIAAQITRIRGLQKKPDVIFVSSCPPGLATAVRQIRSAGITTPLVTGVCGDGDYWLASAPELSGFYNAAYVSTYLDDPRPEVNDFIKAFLARSENPPQRAFAAVGYSEVQAFARAAQNAGTLQTESVRAALEKFKEEPLMVGPTTFNPDQHGDIWRPMAIVEVNNGRHRFVTRWKIQEPPPPKF